MEERRLLTFTVRGLGHPSQGVRHRHRPRLQHLLIEILLLQRREIGFQFVFIDGLGDGHGSDGVADFLGEFVLFAELFPVWQEEEKMSAVVNHQGVYEGEQKEGQVGGGEGLSTL